VRRQLKARSDINARAPVPEAEEQHRYDDSQYPDGPVFCLSEDLVQAIHECSYPQKPFQDGSQHDDADNSGVNDLRRRLANQQNVTPL